MKCYQATGQWRALLAILTVGIVLTTAQQGRAQQMPPDQYLKAISPVTPNASSLGQYGNVPVSMYTGVPDIQIPIYQIKVGDVSIPISLNYHAGGVKVEDYSSWVGTGWSLNAGGVINREQRGDPDENMIDNYSTSQSDFNQLLNPSVSAATKQTIATKYAAAAPYIADMESDIFYYNFAGTSGKFFMDGTGKIYSVPAGRLTIQQDGRITVPNGYRGNTTTAFKRWIITDNNGVKYYFGSSADNTVNAQEMVGNMSTNGLLNAVNSWFLTQIITPGRDTVNFNYQTYAYSLGFTESSTGYFNGVSPVMSPVFATSQVQSSSALRLTSISYPNGQIVFSAGGYREDIPGDQVLDHISIYATAANGTSRLLKTFQLYNNNPAGVSSTASPDMTFRLRFDSVVMFSADSKRIGAYGLTYNNFNNLPSRNSYAQDLWGYYNGQTGNGNLIPKYNLLNNLGQPSGTAGYANRGADSVYSLYGSLAQITYPTGGYSQFQFESNKALVLQDSLLNFFISSASSIHTTSFVYNVPTNTTGNATIDTSAAFTVVNPVAQQTWLFDEHVYPLGSMTCDSVKTGEQYYNPCISATLIGTQTDGTAVNYPITSFPGSGLTVQPGTYRIVVQWASGAIGNASVTAAWQAQPITQNQNEWYVGGLRVKSITNFDPVANSTTVKTYRYTYTTNNRSSGTVETLPLFFYIGGAYLNNTIYNSLLTITSRSESPLITTQGSIVGYANVIEQVDNNGTLGENIYTYTSDDQFANNGSLYQDAGIGAALHWPYPETTNYDWKRGLLEQKQVLVNNGGVLKAVTNSASPYVFSPSTDINYAVVPNVKIVSMTVGVLDYQGLQPVNAGYYCIYYTTTGWSHCDTTRLQTFDNVNYTTSTTKTTASTFDPQALEDASTSVINSDGKMKIKQVKYVLDYNLASAADLPTQGLQNLVSNNKVKQPVEVLEISQDAGGNQTITGGTLLIYYTDKPEIQQVFELKVLQPIPVASFTQSYVNSSGNFIYDSRYELRMTADSYTGKLQLAQETKYPGKMSAYIWDYNGQVPVATVANAGNNDVAYTSFEADGTGNWTLGSTTYDNTQGFTGQASYALSNGAITKTGLTGAKTYVVSYWTKNSTPLTIAGTVTGYPKQGPTLNGWTYYEHRVTGQTTVTVSGSGNIDELRLYPVDAQMISYTYDPLVGITSISNARGEVTYYEYDTFQRLMNIKDQYGNIIKHIDYHFQ